MSWFYGSEVHVGLTGFSALGYTRNQGVGWLGFYEEALGRFTFSLIQVVGRILFLVVVGLSCPPSIPLLYVSWGPPYVLEAPPQFLHMGPYISESASVSNPSVPEPQ